LCNYLSRSKLVIMAKKILITGASGLIGKRLTELLLQKGYQISVLGRRRRVNALNSFVWDIDKGIFDPLALDGVDTIIHLAGAGIAGKRWTAKRKREILESRTKSTALLFNALKNGKHTVTSFVSASAVGYYGFVGEEVFTEKNNPGTDFLAQVARQWEAEADKISELGIRVVKLRTGIVLSEKGGVLAEMVKPVKLGIGSALGSGKQHLTWIHLDDLCEIFVKAVDDSNMAGAYNAVGPQWLTNIEMTKAIAKVLNKPLWLPPVPGFVLKIILGEMANLVIYGSKVASAKIQKAGFEFRFTSLEEALEDLLLKQSTSKNE